MNSRLKKGIVTLGLLLNVIAIPLAVCAATTWYTYQVLNVWSVDSGKHLDWSGSTTYSSNFTTGVNTWNNYRGGVIRQDTVFTVSDVTISDVSDLSGNTVALTTQYHNGSGGKSTSATIQFSTTKMNNLTNVKRNIVCTHELGHTLGLDENNINGTNLIMYNDLSTNTSNNVLHTIDKYNYDYMYNNKY